MRSLQKLNEVVPYNMEEIVELTDEGGSDFKLGPPS